ncbi:hypothetical protein LCGC14_0390240 [marine sediment metagenome]|uniref:GIY-YIG domain-containing protein n=1 Tax=marine sediment metagenome TaxID=412755 RepID=A0A0F9THW6_9ZZZZ
MRSSPNYAYLDNMYLYKITNKINNKHYIGQAVEIARRWSQHKSGARSIINGTKKMGDNGIQVVHLAIAKYGAENSLFKKDS